MLTACKHVVTCGGRLNQYSRGSAAQIFVGLMDFFSSVLLSLAAADFHPRWCPSLPCLSHSSSKAGQIALWGGHSKGQKCLTPGSGFWHPNKGTEVGTWAGSIAWKKQGPGRGPLGWERHGRKVRLHNVSLESTDGSTPTTDPVWTWSQRSLCYKGFAKQLCIFKVFIITTFCKDFLQNFPVL